MSFPMRVGILGRGRWWYPPSWFFPLDKYELLAAGVKVGPRACSEMNLLSIHVDGLFTDGSRIGFTTRRGRLGRPLIWICGRAMLQIKQQSLELLLIACTIRIKLPNPSLRLIIWCTIISAISETLQRTRMMWNSNTYVGAAPFKEDVLLVRIWQFQ